MAGTNVPNKAPELVAIKFNVHQAAQARLKRLGIERIREIARENGRKGGRRKGEPKPKGGK